MPREQSKYAGQTVTIMAGKLQGQTYRVEDWWENVSGSSWMFAQGNPACLSFAMRVGLQDFQVPIDDEVLYGKIDGFGNLVHISEII